MHLTGLVLVLLTFELDFTSACRTTNIYIKNGTWCCGPGQRENSNYREIILYKHTTTRSTTTSPQTPNYREIILYKHTTTRSTTTSPETQPQMDEGATSTPTEAETDGTTVVTPVDQTDQPTPKSIMLEDGANCSWSCGRTTWPENAPDLGGRVLGARPWLGRLSILPKNSTKKNCSAVLISPKWFLSAAHCFCLAIDCTNASLIQSDNDDVNEELDQFRVIFGTKLTEESVKELKIHPEYGQGGPDIALARTEDTVYTNVNGWEMDPICLKFGEVEDDEEYPDLNDLDCELSEGGEDFHYPENSGRNTSKLWCHPGQFMEGNDVNFVEKRSHMTSYGNQEGGNITCTTNSYGPSSSILQPCSSSCNHQPNPSSSILLCRKAEEEGLFLQQLEDGFNIDEDGRFANDKVHGIAWIKIIDKNGEEVTCYSNDREVQSLDEFPYRHGWCFTEDGWGWCSPSCRAENWGEDVHEQIVNSYVFNNCVSGVVENGSEFCAAAPIVEASGKVYELDERGEFRLLKTTLRQSRVEAPRPAQDWGSGGRGCLGDVGGAVWKYVSMVQKEKVAALTGIIRRFENTCGAFREHPEKDEDHEGGRQAIVMTRIRKIMPWIKSQVEEIKNCY